MDLIIEGLIAAAEGTYKAVRRAIEASQLEAAKKQEYLDQLDARIAAKETRLDTLELLDTKAAK